jgi:hypothetical protein
MEEPEEIQELQPKGRPALIINFQSWTTPIVGVVMLILGLFGGYYGRALIAGGGEQAIVPQTVAPAQPQSAGAGNEEMMAYLVSQTRHFKGDPDAPVTLIEFGDFQ